MATITESSAVPPPGTGSAPNGVQPATKKFKASDLPLPSATRSAIDGLAHTFKKKGRYDVIRKQLWAKFEAKVRPSVFYVENLIDCLVFRRIYVAQGFSD